MSAHPDRAIGMAFAVAAGIDEAYAKHPTTRDCSIGMCPVCILKSATDAAWRRWLDAHPVDVQAAPVPEDLNALAARWLSHFQGTELDGLTVQGICGVDDLLLWWDATTGTTRTLPWSKVRAMLEGRD